MTAILGVTVLLGLYGAFGAGRAGWRYGRDRWAERRTQADHEARRAARPAEVIEAEVVDEAEARRALLWRTGFNAHIADINARFDALVAGMPLHDDTPFDPSYWPAVEAPEEGPEVVHVDLTALAEFAPHATLAIVVEDTPTVFSWHTSELPFVERPACSPAALRPKRRRATLRRALGASAPSTII